MGVQKGIGLFLTVAGLGVMIYSRLIAAPHATIPPSDEELAAVKKRNRIFGAGASLSLFGLLLLLT
ncbi:MAG TPA: hypothetical protein VII58_13090 [Acidobacteriaceae bacterium]